LDFTAPRRQCNDARVNSGKKSVATLPGVMANRDRAPKKVAKEVRRSNVPPLRLPHEKPSVGLVLCKSADRVQVRLALTTAAGKIGVARYQTALPDAKLIQRRLERLPLSTEDDC
jgi:hypothetical protein